MDELKAMIQKMDKKVNQMKEDIDVVRQKYQRNHTIQDFKVKEDIFKISSTKEIIETEEKIIHKREEIREKLCAIDVDKSDIYNMAVVYAWTTNEI